MSQNTNNADSSSTTSDGLPPSCGNPYDVLGIPIGSSDDVISKAFKKLALKYHPDKQKNDLKSDVTKQELIQKKFLDITEARNFLLNTEYATRKRAYLIKLQSQSIRQRQNAERDATMNERRKRMRNELERKEQMVRDAAAKGTSSKKSKKSTSPFRTSSSVVLDPVEEEKIKELQRQGEKIKEEQYIRNIQQREAKRRLDAKTKLEERQVRLKWSRRKFVEESFSEHSLTQFLSKDFGEIESVEFIGQKGNSALVTFKTCDQANQCITKFHNSTEMRAFYVGSKKRDEQRKQVSIEEKQEDGSSFARTSGTTFTAFDERNKESIQERQQRRTMEHERFKQQQRQHQQGESHSSTSQQQGNDRWASKGKSSATDEQQRPYPPPMPVKEGMTPLQVLEELEQLVLPRCL